MDQRRIPFEVAISEQKLMANTWKRLSSAQKVALKAMYGIALDGTTKDDRGWTEVDYWNASQGGAEYDEFGYIRRIVKNIAYVPKAYREVWAIWGRRAGKTDSLASTIVAYEAALGGHEAHVRPGQQTMIFQIAQDLRLARYSLHFIKATLEESPLLAKEVKEVTADRIDLRNGITIAVVPPTLKAVRGYANPVTVLDEVGVWYQDSDAANPDYEIYRATKPGQIQFPDRKIVGISSPWNKAGLLYKYYDAGTDGRNAIEAEKDQFNDCLVHHGTTASMGNPKVSKADLVSDRARDPRAFERECLAVFQDSISGFLSSTLLTAATSKGIHERQPEDRQIYVAAMDPAFRRDAFGFTIVHATKDGVVQDVARRWQGKWNEPLNPRAVFSEIARICKDYKVGYIYSDQFQIDSLNQLALEYGLAVNQVPFTATSKAEIFGSLQQILNQSRLNLLDNRETLKELRQLEIKLSQGGSMQIFAPPGEYDDMACVLALAVFKALWMTPAELPDPIPVKTQEESVREYAHKRIQEKLSRRKVHDVSTNAWD